MSYGILILRRKKVSVNLVNVDFLVYIPLLISFFYFVFFIGMATKFDQSMYARMRAKKNEPCPTLGQKI